MSQFVDFAELKERISFEQTINALGLPMKKSGNQWRGACPACKSNDRGLVVTDGKAWFCFSAKLGGDQIALAAHVRECSVKEAAQFLWNSSSTVPQEKAGGEEQKGGFGPLAYLEHDHASVQAIGFDVEFCKAHGIGYAGKGILRGSVAIPFRDETGKLLGYIGVEDCKLPPAFMANVVQFPKTA